MMYILIGSISLLLGGLIIYLCLRRKLKRTQQEDLETFRKNQQAKQQLIDYDQLIADKELSLRKATEQSQLAQQHLIEVKQHIEEMGTAQLEVLNERMSSAADELSQKYANHEDECKKEYLDMLNSNMKAYQEKTKKLTENLQILTAQFLDLQSKTKAAIDARIREEEMKSQEMFYRIHLSEDDLLEIQKLREVSKILRDKAPLNKVIWKVYYENPTTDLISRVVGTTQKTGIYKLTNVNTGMCYVGQAVNIGDRWKQHIKRGLGAEGTTSNKLYPAMEKYGVENFTFEIIDECPREKLNEREQFWQDYFGAKIFGYSIK